MAPSARPDRRGDGRLPEQRRAEPGRLRCRDSFEGWPMRGIPAGLCPSRERAVGREAPFARPDRRREGRLPNRSRAEWARFRSRDSLEVGQSGGSPSGSRCGDARWAGWRLPRGRDGGGQISESPGRAFRAAGTAEEGTFGGSAEGGTGPSQVSRLLRRLADAGITAELSLVRRRSESRVEPCAGRIGGGSDACRIRAGRNRAGS